jgi:hypothetical protein
MNYHLASIHTTCPGSIPRRVSKALLTLSLLTCVLACSSCQDQVGTGMIDTEPLGLGLRVIGYSIVAAAVLGVLSKLVVKP